MNARTLFGRPVGSRAVLWLSAALVLSGSIAFPSLARISATAIFEETVVFQGGADAAFRIPAVISAPNGDVLAFAERRVEGRYIDRGNKDLVLRRSWDLGRSWTALEVLIDHRDYFGRYRGGRVAVGNPSPVVDESAGIIWLVFSIDGSERDGTDHHITTWAMNSDDNGVTWTTPREITSSARRDDWLEFFTGPGHAIQLTSGRLLIPASHSYSRDPTIGYSHVLYSDDHGARWQLGGVPAPVGSFGSDLTNEATAVQLVDGKLMLNMRTSRTRRGVAISANEGASWDRIRYVDDQNGGICQGSITRLTAQGRQDRNRLLFSFPNSPVPVWARDHMTVKISYDEGDTWSPGKAIYPGSAAYSDLVLLRDLTVGLLYERDTYGEIAFARFNLEWLTDGADRIDR